MRVVTMVRRRASDASAGRLTGRALSPVATKFDSCLGIWGKLSVTESGAEDKGGPWSWSQGCYFRLPVEEGMSNVQLWRARPPAVHREGQVRHVV